MPGPTSKATGGCTLLLRAFLAVPSLGRHSKLKARGRCLGLFAGPPGSRLAPRLHARYTAAANDQLQPNVAAILVLRVSASLQGSCLQSLDKRRTLCFTRNIARLRNIAKARNALAMAPCTP